MSARPISPNSSTNANQTSNHQSHSNSSDHSVAKNPITLPRTTHQEPSVSSDRPNLGPTDLSQAQRPQVSGHNGDRESAPDVSIDLDQAHNNQPDPSDPHVIRVGSNNAEQHQPEINQRLPSLHSPDLSGAHDMSQNIPTQNNDNNAQENNNEEQNSGNRNEDRPAGNSNEASSNASSSRVSENVVGNERIAERLRDVPALTSYNRANQTLFLLFSTLVFMIASFHDMIPRLAKYVIIWSALTLIVIYKIKTQSPVFGTRTSQNFLIINIIWFIAYLIKAFSKTSSDGEVDLMYWGLPGFGIFIIFALLQGRSKEFHISPILNIMAAMFWIQATVLGAGIDGIDTPIGLLLTPAYCVCLVLQVFVIIYAFGFALSICGNVQDERLEYSTNLVGNFWYFVVSSMNFFYLVTIIGIENLLFEEENVDKTRTILYVGFGMGVLGLLFRALFGKAIFVFLRTDVRDQILDEEETRNAQNNAQNNEIDDLESQAASPIRPPRRTKIITFVKHKLKKMPYMFMATPTLYQKPSKGFKIRNKSELKQWERQIEEAKFNKYHHNMFKDNAPKVVTPATIDLRHRISSQAPVSPYRRRKNPADGPQSSVIKLQKMAYSEYIDHHDKAKNDESTPNNNNTNPIKLRVGLSENDADLEKKIENPQRAQFEKEKINYDGTCILCFDNSPDAVYMNCGHGGVCYDCAIETWKKSNTCVICRGEIRRIFQVRPVKGQNISKIVKYITKDVAYERE